MPRSRIAWFSCWLVFQLVWSLNVGCRTPAEESRLWSTPTAGSAAQSANARTHQATEADAVNSDFRSVSTGDLPGDASASAQLGAQTQGKSDAHSISYFAEASIKSWQAFAATGGSPDVASVRSQAVQQYHDSLAKFIESVAYHGQFDPRQGIKVQTPDGRPGIIQIACQGFPWQPEDFNEVNLAREYRDDKIARHWADGGFGVPLVVVRKRPTAEGNLGTSNPFAATAVLRPVEGQDIPSRLASNTSDVTTPVVGVLEFYNPLAISQTSIAGQNLALTRDISAPLAYFEKSVNRDNYQSFLRPGRHDARAGLRMLEPYQPGKIPVVFVHGLLSDSVTWVNMINDLRAVPWFNSRYQIWAFQYSTGQSFLRSAAELRQELAKTVSELDGQSQDPALSATTLVGHSMGGLVSKQQITSSGSAIWESIASRPINEIVVASGEHEQIRGLFFFEPLPYVKRVVFIGTPHQGSEWATTLLGRVGSKLVRAPSDRRELLQRLMRDNPRVFSETLRKGIPSSVDFLRPDNALLLATYNRPINPDVRVHSIIGTGKALRDGSPADGVVPVSSARHPAAISEKYIDATHTGLLGDQETSNELARILADHVREFDARGSRH